MSLKPSEVGAVVVTTGDVDIKPVLDSWPFSLNASVWDNSAGEDCKVFGRYRAILAMPREIRFVYVQDDDCVLSGESFEALLAAYEPGKIVANMPENRRAEYPDSCLVGWGAVFDRTLPSEAFDRYAYHYPVWTDEFARACDVVFTTLMPRKLLDVPFEHLPHAHADNRMWNQPGNYDERQRVLAQARKVRDGR